MDNINILGLILNLIVTWYYFYNMRKVETTLFSLDFSSKYLLKKDSYFYRFFNKRKGPNPMPVKLYAYAFLLSFVLSTSVFISFFSGMGSNTFNIIAYIILLLNLAVVFYSAMLVDKRAKLSINIDKKLSKGQYNKLLNKLEEEYPNIRILASSQEDTLIKAYDSILETSFSFLVNKYNFSFVKKEFTINEEKFITYSYYKESGCFTVIYDFDRFRYYTRKDYNDDLTYNELLKKEIKVSSKYNAKHSFMPNSIKKQIKEKNSFYGIEI